MEYCPFLVGVPATTCSCIFKSILDQDLETVNLMIETLPEKNRILYEEWIAEKKDGLYPFLQPDDPLNGTIHRALCDDNWDIVEMLISDSNTRELYEIWKAAKTPEEIAFIGVNFCDQMNLLDKISEGDVNGVRKMCQSNPDLILRYENWNTPETHLERLLRGISPEYHLLILSNLNEKKYQIVEVQLNSLASSESSKSALIFWKAEMGINCKREADNEDPIDTLPKVATPVEETSFTYLVDGENMDKNSSDSSDEENDEAATSSSTYNQDYENYPDVMNILVLGETGVGKTTFINSIANYLCFDKMKNAADGDKTKILVRMKFDFPHPNGNRIHVDCSPTINTTQNSKNEYFGNAQSCTQKSNSYLFEIQTNISRPKMVRIIDTPGIGDTRGISQDKRNFDEILDFVTNGIPEKKLHAICILLKPDNTKLTAAFRFCINELLIRFHSSAMKNILFCFTGTKTTHFKPGESVDTLNEHFKKCALGKMRQGIKLNKETMYVLENDSIRYLCFLKNNNPLGPSIEAEFKKSWKKSREETLRLFGNIAKLPAHDTNKTASINHIRGILTDLSAKLALVAEMLKTNLDHNKDAQREVENLSKDTKDLRKQLMIDNVVLNAEETQKPQTVCRHPDCIKTTMRNQKTNVDEYVYKQICHADCTSQGIPLETAGANLTTCTAFNKRGNPCTKCGHNWQNHIHVNHIMTQSTEKVEDEAVAKSIEDKESAKKTKVIALKSLQNTANKIKEEQKYIENSSEQFTLFLVQNSIIPYNDAAEDYIDMLIRQREDSGSEKTPTETVDQLRKLKSQIVEEVRIIKTTADKQAATPSPELTEIDQRTIEHMMENLKILPHCGKILENMIFKPRSTDRKSMDTNVPLEEPKKSYLSRFLQTIGV